MASQVQRAAMDWTPQEVAQLVSRLEADDYADLNSSLADWKQLKALQYGAPHLVIPYGHLLELEIDED
jgi:hypothetical protein